MRSRLVVVLLFAALLLTTIHAHAISPTLNPASHDPEPLNFRTPLILVHGLQTKSEINGYHRVWDNFIEFVVSELSGEVKPYYFAYETVYPYIDGQPETIDELGLALGEEIQERYASGEFRSKDVIIVAHSLGGLVSRAMMQNYRFPDHSLGGSRVKRLITLGTPHHGVPFSVLGKATSAHSKLIDQASWDSIDTRVPLGICNQWLRQFNYRAGAGSYPLNELFYLCPRPDRLSREAYYDRIIAYGGVVGLASADKYIDELLFLRLNLYWNSDGLIPIASSLFEGWPVLRQRRVDSCDHSDLPRSNCPFGTAMSPHSVFEALKQDIVEVVSLPATPVISAVVPEWLPAVPIPQRQSLIVKGENFVESSNLVLFDGSESFQRAAIYISPTELRYEIAVGPEAADWTVQVEGVTGTSNSYPFHVFEDIDTTPPPSPLALRSIPSGWFNSSYFGIDWTNPADSSGITRLHVNADLPPSDSQSGSSWDLPLFKPYVAHTGEGIRSYYIWLEDGAGNHDYRTAVPVTIRHDFTAPNLSVTSPTSGPNYTTSAGSISLRGSASDALSGLAAVSWSSDRGGSGSTSLSGANWVASSIPLARGENVLTVTATDFAGNATATHLTVTYQEPTGSIRISITPQAAASAGAQWRIVTETNWQSSGNILSELPMGTYQIEYKPISGWRTPSGRSVTISPATPEAWIDSAPYELNGIASSPASFSFFAAPGVNPTPQSLSIFNPLVGTLQWRVSSDRPWLALSPSTGTNQGNVNVTVNASGLAVGVHTAEITISDQAGIQSAQRLPVALSVFASGKINFTWRNVTPMPITHGGRASAVYNGKVHVIGGGPFRDHHRYDPVQGTWDTRARLPSPGIAEGGAALVGSKIYAVNDTPGPILIYDPAADVWIAGATPPSSWRGPSVVGLGGKLYVIGGTDLSLHGVHRNEVYDPLTNQWSTLAPMPTPRGYASAVVLDGRIYVIGGRDESSSDSILGTVEVYDPASNSWATRTPMPTARLNAGAVAINERIYVLGGFDGHEHVDTVEEYTPSVETWRTLSPLLTPRSEVAVGVVGNKIYAIAGSNQSGQLSSTEEGSPTSLPNAPPLAMADAGQTESGTHINLQVLLNDRDPDGDSLRIESVVAPNNGSVTISSSRRSLRYTPNASFVGTEIFSYLVSDSYGGAAMATVSITVLEPTGTLRVVLQPDAAVQRGARWRLASQQTWNLSGDILFGVPFGTHEVELMPVAGWITPESFDVEVLQVFPDVELTAEPYHLAGNDFYTIPPCRVFDTRFDQGPVLTSNVTREIQVVGRCGIPQTATAVSLNVTAITPSGSGSLVIFPDSSFVPNTTTINFQAGLNRANGAVAPLARNGGMAARASIGSVGTVHLILDVNGYFE